MNLTRQNCAVQCILLESLSANYRPCYNLGFYKGEISIRPSYSRRCLCCLSSRTIAEYGTFACPKSECFHLQAQTKKSQFNKKNLPCRLTALKSLALCCILTDGALGDLKDPMFLTALQSLHLDDLFVHDVERSNPAAKAHFNRHHECAHDSFEDSPIDLHSQPITSLR